MREPLRRDASTTTTPAREPGDDAVADRKVLRPRLGARRVLREEKVASARWRSFRRRVLARVVDVEAAAEDRDRSAGALERRLVRRGVHAAREARDDRHARRARARARAARRRPGRSAWPPATRRSRRPEAASRSSRPTREEEEGRVGDLARAPAGTPRRRPSRRACRRARPAPPSARPRRRRRPARTARARSREPEPVGELRFRRRQERLETAPRAQDRPEPLRGQLPAARPGDRARRERPDRQASNPRSSTASLYIVFMRQAEATIPSRNLPRRRNAFL